MLKGALPLDAVRFYLSTVLLKSNQVRDLVHQGDQKAIGIQGRIDGNVVRAVGPCAVIAVSGAPMVDDPQMHLMLLYQLKGWVYSPLGQVFGQGVLHGVNVRDCRGM